MVCFETLFVLIHILQTSTGWISINNWHGMTVTLLCICCAKVKKLMMFNRKYDLLKKFWMAQEIQKLMQRTARIVDTYISLELDFLSFLAEKCKADLSCKSWDGSNLLVRHVVLEKKDKSCYWRRSNKIKTRSVMISRSIFILKVRCVTTYKRNTF